MYQIIKYLIIQFLLLFYACNIRESKVQLFSEDDFLNVIKLDEERKAIKAILEIKDFFIKDSLMFVVNYRNDSVFMIFDLRTMECVKSWGIKGKGPNEYGTFTHLIKLPHNEFLVADFSKFIIQSYSIPEFRLLGDKRITNNRYDRRMIEIPQKIVSPDGLLFFYDKYMMHELVITKWENGTTPIEINQFDSFKKKYGKKSSQVYRGSIEVNPKLKRIIYSYWYFRRFDILDFDGNLINQVEISPSIPPPIFKDKINPDQEKSIKCFTRIRSTDNSIFLYYEGYSLNELERKEFLAETYIEEYNWDGIPINRYKLNRVLSKFDILSDKYGSRVFVGIDENNEIIFLKEK
jgi:hypothetical protein